ncbi:MAG: pyridoxal-phosphate dependent enzyme [Acidobacteria bacterium]|nr:pyridoxal-phosphate dependent enzyme [Acidobacteriota bacterium]MBS1867418.1 pyridoxal-phosphate dependent enzyme [Acidobacteriota bacterium]
MSSPQTGPNPQRAAPSWQAIAEAHARIDPHIHRTPVLTSRTLDRISGAQLFFKCENLQKTGSFKIRGAANAILSLSEEDARRGIVTQSSGNHGAAVACAAAWRGTRAWIVMPKTAPRVKCEAVEGYGGKIAFCEQTVTARKEMAAKVQAETGAVLIHPYDDDLVIAGAATAAKELLEEMPDLDAVLTPVSGGGLLSGTCLSARHLKPAIRLFGCEPAKADDAYRSLQTGTLQSIDSSDTIADGLRASLAPRTFAILRRELSGILLISEEEIISAMRFLWERMKIVVEPSSSIAVAPLLKTGGLAGLHLPARADGAPPKIGIILSGGNVDLSALPFSNA